VEISWHVPSDEERSAAIALWEYLSQIKIKQLQDLIKDPSLSDSGDTKSSADWTDEVRQCMKYFYSILVSSVPLLRCCPAFEKWIVQREDFPFVEHALQSMDISSDEMIVGPELDEPSSPEIDEDDGGDEEDEEEGDIDAALGKSKLFVDGYINQPLPPKKSQVLQSIYREIGATLMQLSGYLQRFKKDEFQCFMDLSMVSRWIHYLT